MFCIVQRVIIVETNIENILLLWGRGRLNFPVKGFFCFGVRFMSGILGSLGGGICQLRVDVFGFRWLCLDVTEVHPKSWTKNPIKTVQ